MPLCFRLSNPCHVQGIATCTVYRKMVRRPYCTGPLWVESAKNGSLRAMSASELTPAARTAFRRSWARDLAQHLGPGLFAGLELLGELVEAVGDLQQPLAHLSAFGDGRHPSAVLGHVSQLLGLAGHYGPLGMYASIPRDGQNLGTAPSGFRILIPPASARSFGPSRLFSGPQRPGSIRAHAPGPRPENPRQACSRTPLMTKEPNLGRQADAQPLDVSGASRLDRGRWVSRKTAENPANRRKSPEIARFRDGKGQWTALDFLPFRRIAIILGNPAHRRCVRLEIFAKRHIRLAPQSMNASVRQCREETTWHASLGESF